MRHIWGGGERDRVGLGSGVGSPSESGQFFTFGLRISDEDKSLPAVMQMITSSGIRTFGQDLYTSI
jgi:hypothetical protein